jgi:hypothetical protein
LGTLIGSVIIEKHPELLTPAELKREGKIIITLFRIRAGEAWTSQPKERIT